MCTCCEIRWVECASSEIPLRYIYAVSRSTEHSTCGIIFYLYISNTEKKCCTVHCSRLIILKEGLLRDMVVDAKFFETVLYGNNAQRE